MNTDARPLLPDPLVSVVLPLHNHARFVAAAIQSVLDQTYRPIELIIIDDGSTDGSAGVVTEFLRTRRSADGIEISFNARANKGAAETINEGLRQARGEYLAILNSDDLYEPSRLQECLWGLSHEKARLLFTYVRPIDETGVELPYDHAWRQWYYDLLIQELDVAPSISFLLLSKNIAVSTGNLVFHRSVLTDVGLFAPYRYAHDLDFLLRYALLEEPAILRKALYQYRLHPTNTIAEAQNGVTDEVIAITKAYLIRCLAGACRNPLAPSFENWPASFNNALQQGYTTLCSALDSLLETPPPAPQSDVAPSPPSPAQPSGREITVVSHELSRTGAPMLVLQLARALTQRGLRVNVIAMRQGPLREEFAAAGIPIRTLDDNGIAHWLAAFGRLFHRLQHLPILMARVFPTSASRVARISPRIARAAVRIGDLFIRLAAAVAIPRLAANIRGTLVINSFASFPLAFQLLARWSGPAFWYIHETYDPQILLRSETARKRFDQSYLSGRIQLLFGSEATRAAWADYGFDGRVRYWSGIPGRAAEARGSPSAARTVLSVGTAGTRKGTRWLLDAFALARTRGWIGKDVTLVIVGCPPPSSNAQARDFLIRAWKDDLRGSVRLAPNVPADALDQYYRNAALYVQSSIMECLPLTLLKAMACRLPIVTTDVDGCKEAIQHGETGLLVPPRQPVPLAEAIAQLLGDDVKAQSLGRNAGIRFTEMFSLETTLEPLVEVLMGTVSAPPTMDGSGASESAARRA